MKTAFFMPQVSFMGENCLVDILPFIKKSMLRKPLIVTDKFLVKSNLVGILTDLLKQDNISFAIFDETKPNPTIENVEAGLKLLKEKQCDFIISFGGGSPHDCAKGIALVAANGGSIKDYEGLDKSSKSQLPLIAVNTTAGTASEMTRFAIITDEARHVKMAIVDQNVTPILAINDPLLMSKMPSSLTAATGMDALTHAVEAFVSSIATPVTDACALMAIELIAENLEKVTQNGDDCKGRDNMAYAEYLAGMAFNNASLGYVHAMAHQLGGFYDLPHGVCNAILLPHVQEYNSKFVPERFRKIAKALGVKGLCSLSDEECADVAIAAIKELAKKVNIPSGLRELGVKESDFEILAKNALKDACGITNPQQASLAEIIAIYKNAM